ncbi:uncharacterized protein LOC123545280 [Mercenaria mercenaria]|uniref:uncharacterized protein LOC123545280 n=1 Tax=Mercenaria mercenaria TaxID=6596 RepID=UPI00234EF5E6|nr:uncharacterized protein LOC123545280 [Mercenaria mercenaria]
MYVTLNKIIEHTPKYVIGRHEKSVAVAAFKSSVLAQLLAAHLPFLFYLILTTCYTITGYSGGWPQKKHARSSRSMQHPAFSMMMGTPMAFPGSPLQGSFRSEVEAECIIDDIVCPAWCLMEDEWGCKYCPCGPANGMSPAKVSEHRHTEMKHEENNNCIGTILCMLSCKDGYKLGSRDREHGCQPCTCVKKNETRMAMTDKTKDEIITSGNNANRSTNSEPCAWPLCMNGNGPNNGPGNGASMTSLPIGGLKAGGSLPGVDCLGPSCSAKNGMHTMGKVSPALKPLLPPQTTPTLSPLQHSTKRPQSASHVNPETQKTLLLLSPTKPPNQLYLLPKPTEAPSRLFLAPVPTEAPSRLNLAPVPTEATKSRCPTLEYCMNNCQYGFQVQNSRQECPDCNCFLPLTPPSPKTTTPKPDFIAIMRMCPDAVHCMKSCTQGYTLISSYTEACPVCTCNREPKVLLLCERPLSCPNGCTVGYKGDEIGCPTCNCVSPAETALKIEIHTTKIDSALTCNPEFSCVDKCIFGYKTGDNGCPTCVCLQPVIGSQHRVPVAAFQMPTPQVVQPSIVACTGPQCSAIHAVPQRLQLLCEQPLSCPYGCTVGFKCDNDGCPVCSCIAPSETSNKIEVQKVFVERVLKCDAKFSCQEGCTFGFKTGPDGCPSCTCLQSVAVHPLHTIPQVKQISVPNIIAPAGTGCLGLSCPSVQQLARRMNIFARSAKCLFGGKVI